MEPILGPGPPLPPPFSLLLLLGLLVIGIWSLLPGHQSGELLPAKISKTLKPQKVPESQKVTKVPLPHWEDNLQMDCTGSDLACFSGIPVGWAQNYTLWSMDRSLQNIFQHLDIARSSLMNLSSSSQVTSTPSSSSSTTGPGDIQTLTCYECHSPEFRVQSCSIHTNLSATQSLAYIFRESLEHRSHSLPNPSKNYSGQAQVLSLPPFPLPQDKKDTTDKNISLDNCAYNSTYEQGLCETKEVEDKNDSWVPKDIRNSLDLHIRKKLAQRLAPPPIFRTIKLSVSPYPLAYSPMRDKKIIKKKGGNRVLKVSNSPSSNLHGRPRLPCWAPIKLSRSARWVLEGHMAWKVCTLRAQRIPAAVKQSWAILNYIIKVQNEDHKPGNSKIQVPVYFLQNTVQDVNKKLPDVSYPILPMDVENDQTRLTTPKLFKADSQPQPTLPPDTQDASCSEVVVIPGEATFLQEDVKKRLEHCIKKKVNSLLKKATKQQKDTIKKDEELSIRLKFQALDTMKLLQNVESVSLGPGPQIKDFKGLIPGSSGQITDFFGLNSGPQVQEFQIQDTNDMELTPEVQKQNVDSLKFKDSSSKVQVMDSVTTSVPEKHDADSVELTLGSSVQDVDSMGSIPEPQIKNVDSGGLIPGSQVKLTDSKKLVKGSQVKLTDSEGLIPWSQVKLTDSKGQIPGSQVKLRDSNRVISGSQVKLTDSKGLIPWSQVKLEDSKGLISGSQVKLEDSKGLISGSQVKLTDSKGLISGSQVKLEDSKGLIPWSQVKLTDSKGLISGSQVKLTDSKGLIPETQISQKDSKELISESWVKLTDSKGLIPESQVSQIDSKGLIPDSWVKLTDSKGQIPESQIGQTDSKGLIPESLVKLTDSKELIPGSLIPGSLMPGSQVKLTDFKGPMSGCQAKLTDSEGLIQGSQVKFTESKGLIPGSQVNLTNSKELILESLIPGSMISGSQVKLTDSKGLISGSQVRLKDSKGLIPGSQITLTDSKGLISGSQARLTDSKGLIPGSQVRLTESKGLIPGSQTRLTDSKGLIPGSQARLTDSKGLIPGSQVRLSDSKGLIPGSQVRLTESKGLIPGSQTRLTDSKGLIPGSQARLTDSKGLIPGSQVRLTESKGLISGSQARLTDSKGLIPGSQARLTDSKGLIPGSQVKPTDSKELTLGSQVRLTDSKGLIIKPNTQVKDSVELTPWPRIQGMDSVEFTSRSKIQVTDPKQLGLELHSPVGDTFHFIQGSIPLYISQSGRITVKLKHASKAHEILRTMLRDLNGSILLQKSFFRISSKFPNRAQLSTFSRPLSGQPSHSLCQWRLSPQYLSQAPILSSRRSDHSFHQEGLRTPTALKWPVSGRQVKAWEQRISKGRVTRRKSSSTSMLRKNLWVKMQQTNHVQADQIQRPSQVTCSHAPNCYFSPSKQAMVSEGWQEKIMGTPPGTSLSNYIQRDTLCQLCRKNLPFNEQLENSKSITSQDYPNLTTKGAQDSSKPIERRKEMEQVPSDLRVLPQSTSPQLPSSHKIPSTKNPTSVEQKEKPGISSRVRTSESQSKPLSVTSPYEQAQLLQDLQLKITQQLLKNQLSPHFTPSLTKGMFLQYPICLQCGRCSGPSCPHKFHDTSGPWLLIYPQLRLFRNSEGHGEFRVQLGFKLRNRTQIPKQQREVGPLLPMGHENSQPDPLEKKKSKVCTCHINKKNLTLSPYPKTNLGHQPFQTLESSQTSGPIQVHIKRNFPGRRVEATKAKSEEPDHYDFIKVHSLLNTDSKGGWAKSEGKQIFDSEQMKSPKIRTTTHKIKRVCRQSIPKDRERYSGRRTMEAPKEAPPSRHSEESTGFMQWLCLSIKKALGTAYPPKPSSQQMQAPWESPASQQGSVSSEQSHVQQGSKNEGKQWVKSLKTTCLATKMERKKPEKDKKRQRFTLLRRIPKNTKINQSRLYFKSTYKSTSSHSSTSPVPESNKISHSKSSYQNTPPGQEKCRGGSLNSNKTKSNQEH